MISLAVQSLLHPQTSRRKARFILGGVALDQQINLIENVTEYEVDIIQGKLGPNFEVKGVRLDPRVFGLPTARPRLYALAFNKNHVQWVEGFDLMEFIDALTSQVALTASCYWWSQEPPSKLTDALDSQLLRVIIVICPIPHHLFLVVKLLQHGFGKPFFCTN